jgi:archaeosine synthase beta-subunit
MHRLTPQDLKPQNLKPPRREELLSLRPPKLANDPYKAHGYVVEREPVCAGGTVSSATYFLTGSECRFKCSFCDLWKYTLDTPTPIGSLTHQIQSLHRELASEGTRVEWLKLYNAANFFDTANVPLDEYESIASECESMHRIVVENHPLLTVSKAGLDRIRAFKSLLRPSLEIAMGLESIDPGAIRVMNKSLHRSSFDKACDRLLELGITIRVFVILQPAGTRADEASEWAVKTCQYAFQRGAERCGIIPARSGNGWMDRLSREGLWSPPRLPVVEQTLQRLFAVRESIDQIATIDLWDWDSLAGGCNGCLRMRYDTLERMNLEQRFVERQRCSVCESVE